MIFRLDCLDLLISGIPKAAKLDKVLTIIAVFPMLPIKNLIMSCASVTMSMVNRMQLD